MKKLFLLTFAILMTSNIALACGGIMLKGKYCMSKHTMNWYSASAWCQAQGMNLVDVKEECGTLGGYNACTALDWTSDEEAIIKEKVGALKEAWTNTSVSAGNAYAVNWNGNISGYTLSNLSRTGLSLLALCK